MRHVLIVSFGYEPLSHVSATRATHMSQALTALDWDVSVLTVDWSSPLPDQVASVEESLTRALEEPSPRRIAIDGRLIDSAFDPSTVIVPNTEPPPPRWEWLRKLQTFHRTLTTGPYAGWARRAFAAAEKLHRERPIDIVWAIHGDVSCHAIAYWLRGQLHIPWIADFKDSWNKYHTRPGIPVQRFAMARRLRSAEALTETCASQAANDSREFGVTSHVIYSGYDDVLMTSASPKRPAEGFSITYMGAFGNSHDTCMLRDVFSELAQRGCIESGEFEVYQYGSSIGQIRGLLGEAGCASIAREFDRVPRPRVFSLMRGADVLLILPLTSSKGRLVGLKEIESFASGSPVLVLGEPLAELMPVVRACPQVHVALTPEEGADFLEAESGRVRAGASSRGEVNIPALEPFTWSVQASRLSELLVRCRRRPPSRTSESRAA